MILADTSVWVDHLRSGNPAFVRLLRTETILIHPFVIGELALGCLNPREGTIAELHKLLQAKVAADNEVLRLIESERLFGLGIGYVDAHLLASVRLTPSAVLWTRDKRLHAVADRLSMAARID